MDTSVPVVVIYRGGNGALAIARTLARLGVRMYLVAQPGSSPVTWSRYWSKTFWWNFSSPQEETLKLLVSVARHVGGKPVLLTLADWAAIFIEDHADALKEHYVFPRGSPSVVRSLLNKWEMFHLARRHGIPTPETAYPRCREDVERFLQTARFPVMVKGADSFLPAVSKEIIYNARDLVDKFDRASESGPANLIFQEFIPGVVENVWMCNAYFDSGSECKAVFTGKKLRQVSDTGVASLAVCLPNEQVERSTKHFMQSVGYSGAVGIGYRFDERDGLYKVLDVNARVSGVFRLFRATDGMDIVRICYLDLTGQPVPASRLSAGRKWMLEDDFEASLREVAAGKLTLSRWFQSVRGVRETQWFAADDPLPFVIWLGSFVRWFWNSIWAKVLLGLRELGNNAHISKNQAAP
jgi:D-aspartate ligase